MYAIMISENLTSVWFLINKKKLYDRSNAAIKKYVCSKTAPFINIAFTGSSVS